MRNERDCTNHLIDQTSPYLLQHAHNPVEWYPWGPEALEKARREDKPILLSIGYSACHWCHVMAHESFEDPATAARMNALFVNIKVDREERPDLDKIYQTAHHLLAQRTGGWPLTMFLMPDDHVPFFGGTYFPPEPRHGLPSFKDMLEQIAQAYRNQRAAIDTQNESLRDVLARINAAASGTGTLDTSPLAAAQRELEQHFDKQHGGFGRAPKFPHPSSLAFLLRQAQRPDGESARRSRAMAVLTLTRMGQGGIFDQLGGGFARYSVDEQWMIPHFEKMLYDNGPLLVLYSHAAIATGDALFARVARETAQWVIREMQSPEGGYYSSLDADSEGEEGKFYVWSQDEVRRLISEAEYPVFARRFGLDRDANFEGHWNLHGYVDVTTVAGELGLDAARVTELIDSARRKLLAVRERRIHPGRDDKILTAWNALMISGMAVVGRHLDDNACLDSAQRALDFIHAHLWVDGRLLATYKDGHAHLPAYLDDYAFLIDAIIELLQVRWRTVDMQFAMQLADVLLTHFEDKDSGGFFFTADDHEQLIQRPKSLADESMPSGNGIAALALGRLGHILGETRYLDAAERTLKAAWPAMTEMPYAHVALIIALDEFLNPPQTIVLRGTDKALNDWHVHCAQPYVPGRIVLAIPADETNLPGLLAERKPQGEIVAYVCEGMTCRAPITNKADLPGPVVNG
ncbi:MAG: thioredoxin domain-containing protein [Gammaproteobacteria bacterium]